MAAGKHIGELTVVGFLDLVKHELRNAIIQNLASAPSSPVAGQVYFDTGLGDDGTLRVRGTSGNWIDLGPSDEAPPSYTDEQVRDVVAALFSGGTQTGATVTYDDGADTLSITITGSPLLEGEDGAYYLDRSNHNGTQPSTTISDFDTSVEALITAAIADLVDSAPSTLDTLNELAQALGDDPDFATTITNQLATKASVYATTIGNGAATSFNIQHDLGVAYPEVAVYETSTGAKVSCEVTSVDANNLTLSGWETAPDTGAYAVRVIG